MMYLSILTGAQAGNFIEIDSNKTISMASSFGSDIYLLLDNSDFESTFKINGQNELIIENLNKEILADGLPLEVNVPYATPILFTIDGISCAISNNPYIQVEDFAIATISENTLEQEALNEPTDDELNALGIKPFDESTPQKSSIFNRVNQWINQNRLLKLIKMKLNECYNSKLANLLKIHFSRLITKFIGHIQKIYQRIGYWIYLIIAIIMTIIISSMVILYQLQKQEQAEITIHERQIMKTLLNQQILKLPNRYANLRISNINDNYQLEGVVANSSDVIYLTKLFNKINPHIKYKLELFSKIKPSILAILNQHKVIRPLVEFESDTGTLKINGITNNMEVIDDAEIAISNQYPNLGKIDSSSMFLIGDIDENISTMTGSANYKDHLEVKKDYSAGVITIEGYLSVNDIINLTNQVKQFNQKYAPELAITLNVQDLVKALPFTIREVYSGNPSYVITGDGQRIYQGGSYKSITINSINKDRIVFQGKFTLTLSLNQLLPAEGNSNIQENNILDYNDTKDQMLDTERNNESQAINKIQAQLNTLNLILDNTAESQLKKPLQETIQNLENDLNYRKREYQYYFKDSK